MVYAVWKRYDGEYDGGVFDGWNEYFSDTWNPQTAETDIALISDHAYMGRTYEDKKNYIRQKAIEYQYSASLISLSYMELMIMGNYFEKIGRRFGLLREFRENGIC